ncbi:MAG: hypothetical protein ACOCUY_01905 [Verrucomicrobiota bacterium]
MSDIPESKSNETVSFDARDRAQQAMKRKQSPRERLQAMARAQRQAFACLDASPEGRRRFVLRNVRKRRARYINGEWRPVQPDQCADETRG